MPQKYVSFLPVKPCFQEMKTLFLRRINCFIFCDRSKTREERRRRYAYDKKKKRRKTTAAFLFFTAEIDFWSKIRRFAYDNFLIVLYKTKSGIIVLRIISAAALSQNGDCLCRRKTRRRGRKRRCFILYPSAFRYGLFYALYVTIDMFSQAFVFISPRHKTVSSCGKIK